MKKLFYLVNISLLFLFASCSNNDITEFVPEVKTYTPNVQGTMGQLTGTHATPQTKTGIVEDNPDYDSGELFYWHNGDQVKMLFFPEGNLNSTPTELIYTAVVPDGQKPNSCEFTTTGSITAGNYTVYGLYPADGWSKDEIGYKATSAWFSFQNDASSAHLKDHLFMKAKAANVAVGEGSPINLSFKHLSAVVRFRITDESRPTPLALLGFDIIIKDNSNFFPTAAYLDGGIDGNILTPIESSRIHLLTVFQQEGQNFTDKGAYREFDVFMPVLPTGAPDASSQRLVINSTLGFTNGQFTVSQQQTFNTDQYYRPGLSFEDDIPFLRDGFEAGKSYYFNLQTSEYF